MTHWIQVIIALAIGISVHEAAHALMANLLGDPTGKIEGRITLNPLAHLDLWGTLMIFLAGFGWGKPVPYNPYNLKDPKMGALWIALAGPGANFLCAFVFALIFKGLIFIAALSFLNSSFGMFLIETIQMIIFLNIALMAFNLIPIPPLDGSKVVAAFTPDRHTDFLHSYFQYGPIILMVILILERLTNGPGLLDAILSPIISGTLVLFGLVI